MSALPGLGAPAGLRGEDELPVATIESYASSTGSLTVNKPSGTAAGDLLLILAGFTGSSDGVAPPAGFTVLTDFDSGESDAFFWNYCYKIADGSEGSSFTLTGNTTGWPGNIICLRISGAAAPTISTLGAGQDPPSHTSPAGAVDTLWLAVILNFNTASQTAPTAYPTNYPGVVAQGTSSGNRTYIAVGSRFIASATENAGAFSGSSLASHAWMIAVPSAGAGAGATVPSAFSSGHWSIAPGSSSAAVTISALPSNGGSAIYDIEYRVDGGSWTSSGGTGDFTILSLSNGVEYDVEIRAVNSVGASSASDTKQVTPDAGGSGGGLEEGMLLHLPMDEGTGTTAADAVGSFDGTLGGTATWVAGDVGTNAVFYNDSSAAVTIADDSGYKPTAAMSMALWYAPEHGWSAWGDAVNQFFGSNGIKFNPGAGEITVCIGGAARVLSISTPPDNAGRHYAFTYDGTDLKGYVNGIEEDTIAVTGSISHLSASLQLGLGIRGRIDDFRIWDRALTPTEVAELAAM